jgi:lipopolysaccharide heptosyltransferase II
MSEPGRILVVAPNWLGDAVMALPALADIRRAYAQARLIVAARPSVAPLYSMVPGVDATIVTQWRGSVTDRERLQEDVQQMLEEQVERAILFPNSFSSAWVVRRARVRDRWGYAADLRRPLLTRAVRRPRGSRHQGAYYQHLVRELGIPTGALEPVLTVPGSAVEEARSLLRTRGWEESRPMLVVAPGAAYGTAKRWLPRHFAALISRAIREAGVGVVLVGAQADAESARLVLDSTGAGERAAIVDLTGATTLQTLAGVMSLAAACVSNDSGAMHLAGAVGTPLAALFGPTREKETAPLTRHGGRSEVLINHVWCRPCMLRECPFEHQCMTGLKPERVFESVRVLMGTRS